jgi:hypothetical protein
MVNYLCIPLFRLGQSQRQTGIQVSMSMRMCALGSSECEIVGPRNLFHLNSVPCLSLHLPFHLPTYLYLSLPISTYLPTHLPTHIRAYILNVHTLARTYIPLSIYPYVCLSLSLSLSLGDDQRRKVKGRSYLTLRHLQGCRNRDHGLATAGYQPV